MTWKLSDMRLGLKLGLIVIVAVAGLLGASAWSLYALYEEKHAARSVKVQQLVESAVTLVGSYEAAARAGELSVEDAQKAARRAVGSMRYGGNEYFWINDLHPKMIMHPIRPELDGQDVSGMKDPTGKRLFVEFADVVRKSGSGFVYYLWPKPGLAEPVEKISYVKGFAPWGWIIGSGIYLDDVAQEFRAEAIRNGTILLVVAVIVVLVAFAIVRQTAKPIGKLTGVMTALVAGDYAVEVPGDGRRDEIGDMARAVKVFKAAGEENIRLQTEQKETALRSEREKKAVLTEMADALEAAVRDIVENTSSAATEMQASAQSLSSTAETTQLQAETVAAASEEASANVQTVATAAEELSSSISEISRQVTESAEIADRAVAEARHTNEKVQGLSEAARRIGTVVQLINDIASQTNLLALNATIEAARAGEAGKGFSVVASEVKSLASQTTRATEEIAAQVDAIQRATNDAVSAIESIGGTISRINVITTTIASAVEEQGAATQEIARNVQQASKGTAEVTANISEVTSAASVTGRASSEVATASSELSVQATHLRDEVSKFLVTLRAA